MAAVTPTDRPTLDCNRCVIEYFVGVNLLFEFSMGVRSFIIGLIKSFPFTILAHFYAHFMRNIIYTIFGPGRK